MKKRYILYTLGLLETFSSVVMAAPSYSFKTSNSSITNGGKVTASVTVSSTASWQIKITSSGNTYGCTNSWADATSNAKNTTKTFSVTCKASSVGVVNFTLSGNITDESGNTVNLSGSKSVSVKEKAPDSKVNALSSLKVDGYELSPAFDSEVLEYSVNVPPNTTKINISATKKDSTSSVSGTGEFDVVEGDNKFTIDVKAQNGDLRTYTINVSVTDENPIKVNVLNEEYTIMKTSRNLEIPSLYSETTMEIDGNTIPCFVNEETGITLVALKNSYGVIDFFIYEEGNYTKYVELTSDNLILMPTNNSLDLKGYTEEEIAINDNKVKAYHYKKLNNNYYVLEAKNLEDNTVNKYLYNSKDNTFMLFDDGLYQSIYNDMMFYLYTILGCAGIIILSLIIILIISSKNKKIRKLVTVLEEKIKLKDKEIEKRKNIYYNNKHKKHKKDKNTNEVRETGDTTKESKVPDDTEDYNILKD